MQRCISRLLFCSLLSAGAVLIGSLAIADIIPTFASYVPNGAGGLTFSYTASLSSGSRVNTGDYFTIYDFQGLISGSEVAPAGWTFSEQNIGITPAGQIVYDRCAIVNITFTYIGQSSIIGPVDTIGIPGGFTADTIPHMVPTPPGHYAPLGYYASQTHKNNQGKPDDNTFQSNQGRLRTPVLIPEGSSIAALLAGLLPIGILLRRSRVRHR